MLLLHRLKKWATANKPAIPNEPTEQARGTFANEFADYLAAKTMVSNDYIKAALAFLGVGIAVNAVKKPQDLRGKQLPLSLRNNNPGALMYTGAGIDWQGRVKSTENNVYRFSDLFYGTRALAKTLHTYYFTHELRTLYQIFKRYAPFGHGGNNPNVYAEIVASKIGVKPNDHLAWNRSTVKNLIYAIADIESGINAKQYLSDTIVSKAILAI